MFAIAVPAKTEAGPQHAIARIEAALPPAASRRRTRMARS
jgi:hypothetical protein